jgi:hypothetical protein
MAKTGSPPVAWRLLLGDDFPAIACNQVRNVTERRIRTDLRCLIVTPGILSIADEVIEQVLLAAVHESESGHRVISLPRKIWSLL